MSWAQYAAVPDTLEAVTGTGSRHIYYGEPSDLKIQNSAGAIGPGINVSVHYGYVVACSSIHPETKRKYDWDGLLDIEQQKIVPVPVSPIPRASSTIRW